MGTENSIPVKQTVVISPSDPVSRANMKIEFDYDSCMIRTGAYGMLNELGRAVIAPELAGRQITVEWHTDSDGSQDYNLRLSLKRAESVKNFLVGNFRVSRDRIRVLGYGESMPLKANTTSDNKQLNRRVEIQAR